jgi:branched-chain amino acid transport system permease protein
MEQQLVNGLALGSMYALVALGYTLILGVLRLLNLAHGEIFMLGGFVGAATLAAGLPIPLALLGAALGAGLLGLLVERVCFRPAPAGQELTPALSSVAFGIVLVDLAIKRWGSEPYSVQSGLGGTALALGPVQVSYAQLLILGVALALMLALDLVVRRTSLGRALRAVAESPVSASLAGVDTRRLIMVTFAATGALAGVAGLLLVLRTGVASPTVGLGFGIKALAVMAVGGLGNLRGAMVAGLLLGILEVMSLQVGLSSYSDLVVWLALVAVLIFRPGGLFGSAESGIR